MFSGEDTAKPKVDLRPSVRLYLLPDIHASFILKFYVYL